MDTGRVRVVGLAIRASFGFFSCPLSPPRHLIFLTGSGSQEWLHPTGASVREMRAGSLGQCDVVDTGPVGCSHPLIGWIRV